MGRIFVDPELGPCTVSSLADPILLAPDTGNLAPGLRLAPGYHHALSYYDLSGRSHTSSVPEVAHWVCTLPPHPVPVTPAPVAASAVPPENVPSDFRAPNFFLDHTSSDFFGPSFSTGDPWDRYPAPFSALSATSAGARDLPSPLSYATPTYPAALRQYFSLEDFPALSAPSAGAFSAISGPIPSPTGTILPPTYAYPAAPGAAPALPAPATLNLDHLGRPLTWSSCLSGPNRDLWLDLSGLELIKLVRSTGTLAPCMKPTKTPTYYNQVPGEKWRNNAIARRVRGTGGGDRITVPYSVSTSTANLPTVKCTLHAVVSENASFGTVDITDFYLGSPMPSPEFLKLPTSDYHPDLLDDLGITPFIQLDRTGKPVFYAQVNKTIPGFPQAGFHANNQLVAHLQQHGYLQTSTPSLFRHITDNIAFCLVVDDFGIKYSNIADFHKLVDCLALLYHVKATPNATSFLGLTLDYDTGIRALTLSMPEYIPALLQLHRPLGVRLASSPSIYIPPKYDGSSAPQMTPEDTSPPASAAQKKELQEVIGSLLYYARILDHSLLPTVTYLACFQASPTLATMAAMERLLGYCAKRPNATQVIRPSPMLLKIFSDASYLNRPKSGSTIGGLHTLSDHDPANLNASVHAESSRIPVVVASAGEAELASAFGNAKIGHDERTILRNLGYPQPPTPIFCDNECTIGLAHDVVRKKQSKSMDLRWDWLRDRVAQNMFILPYIRSLLNPADFFTKALPVYRHNELAPLYVSYPPSPSSR